MLESSALKLNVSRTLWRLLIIHEKSMDVDLILIVRNRGYRLQVRLQQSTFTVNITELSLPCTVLNRVINLNEQIIRASLIGICWVTSNIVSFICKPSLQRLLSYHLKMIRTIKAIISILFKMLSFSNAEP